MGTRWLGTVLVFCLPGFAAAAELALRIEGLESMDGSVRVALYGQEENWLSSHTLDARVVPLNGRASSNGAPRLELTFVDLPAGPLAVAAFHDRDADGDLDSGFMGLPAEPMGFSAPHHWKIPPDFAEAAVMLNEVKPAFVVVHLH